MQAKLIQYSLLLKSMQIGGHFHCLLLKLHILMSDFKNENLSDMGGNNKLHVYQLCLILYLINLTNAHWQNNVGWALRVLQLV